MVLRGSAFRRFWLWTSVHRVPCPSLCSKSYQKKSVFLSAPLKLHSAQPAFDPPPPPFFSCEKFLLRMSSACATVGMWGWGRGKCWTFFMPRLFLLLVRSAPVGQIAILGVAAGCFFFFIPAPVHFESDFFMYTVWAVARLKDVKLACAPRLTGSGATDRPTTVSCTLYRAIFTAESPTEDFQYKQKGKIWF